MKKNFLNHYTLLFFTLSLLSIFLFINLKKDSSRLVYNPLKDSSTIDINGDGTLDSVSISSYDSEINISNHKYSLNAIMDDNSFSSLIPSWPTKIFVNKLSRSIKPVLIIQSNKNNKGIFSVINWDNDHFNIIDYEEKNIFGFLDSEGSRTPRYYSLNSSSGNSSLKSFMILDNKLIDITKDTSGIPGIDYVLTFLDLIQADYEPDYLPPIFEDDISSKELALLWNLDKYNFNYSFQDGFFYDNSIDDKGKVLSIKWRLTFEKYNKGSDDSSKEEIILFITSKITSDNSYRISSISLQ